MAATGYDSVSRSVPMVAIAIVPILQLAVKMVGSSGGTVLGSGASSQPSNAFARPRLSHGGPSANGPGISAMVAC